MGRGSVVDPSPAFAQYFETGGSPRIGFSSPEVDALLQKERATFDPEERKKVINQAFAKIVEEQPACFLWKHTLLYGVAKSLDYTPTPTGRVWGIDMAVK
jgi:peptide/nickel transport system substrate-binding protein